ncbi:hypothetical protein BB560_000607 [Smittium megazygosporum]|uniref:Uncharacterized protein n=1 Tax=Smittium megazygosporum TaxID=133381 RepID=A0A2T9ZJX8_9FUNG|nr:hypothetical protein BB560_000607 [Smittium megazygosporum]
MENKNREKIPAFIELDKVSVVLEFEKPGPENNPKYPITATSNNKIANLEVIKLEYLSSGDVGLQSSDIDMPVSVSDF